MNKKFLLFGAVAVAGFITLTAFGGKTLAEQQAEITKMVTEKLDAYKTELQAACDERVASEAQTRFDKIMADKAAAEAAKPVPGKKPVAKKPVAKGPKVDPLPQGNPPTKPTTTTEQKKAKMEGTPNTQEKQDKMSTPAPNTDKKKAKMEGGGN